MYDGDKWTDCGRLGDSIEINGLAVYNGKLYAGSIPRAEVFRYEGGTEWTRMKRFFSPPGWVPRNPGARESRPENGNGSKDWTRVTSLTVFNGRLFASIGSCTSALVDAPADVRGKVFSMQAGQCISYDRDLGAGWKHIAAVRRENRLELFVNGKRRAVSATFDAKAYDTSNTEPLKIGNGELDYFSGKLQGVRYYNRALEERDIRKLMGADSPTTL
jgi:hypothetical protein